jgi:hypothetical protein
MNVHGTGQTRGSSDYASVPSPRIPLVVNDDTAMQYVASYLVEVSANKTANRKPDTGNRSNQAPVSLALSPHAGVIESHPTKWLHQPDKGHQGEHAEEKGKRKKVYPPTRPHLTSPHTNKPNGLKAPT